MIILTICVVLLLTLLMNLEPESVQRLKELGKGLGVAFRGLIDLCKEIFAGIKAFFESASFVIKEIYAGVRAPIRDVGIVIGEAFHHSKNTLANYKEKREQRKSNNSLLYQKVFDALQKIAMDDESGKKELIALSQEHGEKKITSIIKEIEEYL